MMLECSVASYIKDNWYLTFGRDDLKRTQLAWSEGIGRYGKNNQSLELLDVLDQLPKATSGPWRPLDKDNHN